VFGAASVLSPVLWQIYSQRRHWDVLREQELLEPRAPKMTKARWVLWLGETWFIYRRAVREGISDRAEAVARFRPEYEQRHAPKAVQSAPRGAEPVPAPAEAVELAAALQRWSDTQLGRGPGAGPVATSPAAATASATDDATDDATEELPPDPYGSRLARTPWLVADLIPLQLPPRAVLRPAGAQPMQITVGPGGMPMAVAQPVAGPTDPRGDDDQQPDRKRPTEQDRRRVVRMWVNRVRKDEVLSKRDLADRTGYGDTWCLDRIREGRGILAAEGWTFDDNGRPSRPVAEPVASDGIAETA
jgi:hypothetical protein